MEYHKGKNYQNKALQKKDLNDDPIISFDQWINEAKNFGIEDYNAFHLSTSDMEGNVSGRIVLLKSIINNKIIFFTDYSSRKGQQITNNEKVAVTFYWGKLERQIRMEGTIEQTSDEVNDHYFALRPKESQAAAIASKQSEKIDNRAMLEKKFNDTLYRKENLTRPSSWGGYAISPDYFEFWQGRPNRLNDRIAYARKENEWIRYRLEP